MLSKIKLSLAGVAAVALLAITAPVRADSISPTSFSALLGVGDSVTVHKTVTISDQPPTSGVLDVMFLFDTTGSMGAEIAAAKSKAADILTALSGFGSVAAGTGWYNDPTTQGLTTDLTTNLAQANIDIGNIPGASGGGDADELGVQGIIEATGASWRPGSSRFVIAFGDAAFKGVNQDAIDALNNVNATFIGVGFLGGGSDFFSDANPIAAATGGSTYSADATDANTIANAIIAGVGSSFAIYGNVTVGDLGGGLPEIAVSTVCTSADIGVCVGSDAVGAYDRSVMRTFGFDVTFTRLAPGDTAFPTFALVDGAIVATEADRFPSAVPEPATLGIIGLGLLGLAITRRRRAA